MSPELHSVAGNKTSEKNASAFAVFLDLPYIIYSEK